jgi:hypothetical protein
MGLGQEGSVVDYDEEVVWALSYLRTYAKVDARPAVKAAIETLDNAGVFHHIDKQTTYASAAGIRMDPSADAQAATWEATGERETGPRSDSPQDSFTGNWTPPVYPEPPADALAILWEERAARERQEDDDRWSGN